MPIDTALNTVSLHGEKGAFILGFRRMTTRFVFDHLHLKASDTDIDHAVDFIDQLTKIRLPRDFVVELLDLHPYARVLLAAQGIQREDVQNALADAVSLTFLGCPWPRKGEAATPESDCTEGTQDYALSFEVFMHKLHRHAKLFVEGK